MRSKVDIFRVSISLIIGLLFKNEPLTILCTDININHVKSLASKTSCGGIRLHWKDVSFDFFIIGHIYFLQHCLR